MKILILYACVGGNRLKWSDKHDITAVEIDPELARIYKKRFPKDKVIIADAHQYLLDHFNEYEFIWSSPPCPTHSRANYWASKTKDNRLKYYPDMKLYQEIIFLDKYFKGKYVVENVIPYYQPLIPGIKRGRHLFWCNFQLPTILSERKIKIGSGINELKNLCNFHEIDLSTYKGHQRKDKIARNLVDYEAGKTILDTAMNILTRNKSQQTTMF